MKKQIITLLGLLTTLGMVPMAHAADVEVWHCRRATPTPHRLAFPRIVRMLADSSLLGQPDVSQPLAVTLMASYSSNRLGKTLEIPIPATWTLDPGKKISRVSTPDEVVFVFTEPGPTVDHEVTAFTPIQLGSSKKAKAKYLCDFSNPLNQ